MSAGNPRTCPIPASVIGDAFLAVAKISEREEQVWRGLVEAKTNTEIGAAIYISEDTVKTHLRRLFPKIGARNRSEAIAIAYRRGIAHVPTAAPNPAEQAIRETRIPKSMTAADVRRLIATNVQPPFGSLRLLNAECARLEAEIERLHRRAQEHRCPTPQLAVAR